MNNRRRTYGVSSSKINEILISTSDSIYKVSESGNLTNIHSYSNDTTYNYLPMDMYVADDDTLVVLKRSINSNDHTYVNTANLNTTISFTNREEFTRDSSLKISLGVCILIYIIISIFYSEWI